MNNDGWRCEMVGSASLILKLALTAKQHNLGRCPLNARPVAQTDAKGAIQPVQ